MNNKNGGRNTSINLYSFMDIFPHHHIPNLSEICDKTHARSRKIRGEDRTLEQRQYDLFGPDFAGWDNVPAASLEDRELPPPSDCIPTSRDDTIRFCSQLVDKGGNEVVIGGVMGSWPEVRRLADRLWTVGINDRPFFDAVITGRHRTAMLYMREQGVPRGLSERHALSLIADMSMVWCAHDVQMTAARVRRVSTRPLENFLLGEAQQLGVATAHSRGRRMTAQAEEALYAYCTEEELFRGKRQVDQLSGKSETRLVKKYIEEKGVPILFLQDKKKLDKLVVDCRASLAQADGDWWGQVVLEGPGGDFTSTKFSEIFWSGMKGFEPLAVTVLRFLQAEALMKSLVCETYAAVNLSSSIKDEKLSRKLRRDGPLQWGFLPNFRISDLNVGWSKRFKSIMRAYDHSILGGVLDKPSSGPKKNPEYKKKAERFLLTMGQRHIGDDYGDSTCPRRTFYLLDVLPDVRLNR